MADKKEQKIKNYADGWITEREGTDVPGFLKLAFPVIAVSCTAYIVLYMYGEVAHGERGPLVQAFNAATGTSPALMYGVAGLAALFTIIVSVFAFGKPHE